MHATLLMLVYSMLDYLYVPPTQPMDIDGWPKLADMVISNKRVVAMLAYDADQQKVRLFAITSSAFAFHEAHRKC
jgi:hypothetical protein